MSKPNSPPKQTELPGVRIREYRKNRDYSQRELAESCSPPMDYSSISRIEGNFGYTKDSLERLARVLGCNVSDFFLYEELKGYSHLSPVDRQNVADYINALLKKHQVVSSLWSA